MGSSLGYVIKSLLSFVVCFAPAAVTSYLLYLVRSKMKGLYNLNKSSDDISSWALDESGALVTRWAVILQLVVYVAAFITFKKSTWAISSMVMILLFIPSLSFYLMAVEDYFWNLTVKENHFIEARFWTTFKMLLATWTLFPVIFFIYGRKAKTKRWQYSSYLYLLPTPLFLTLGTIASGIHWPESSQNIVSCLGTTSLLMLPITLYHTYRIRMQWTILTATPEQKAQWDQKLLEYKAAQEKQQQEWEARRKQEELEAQAQKQRDEELKQLQQKQEERRQQQAEQKRQKQKQEELEAHAQSQREEEQKRLQQEREKWRQQQAEQGRQKHDKEHKKWGSENPFTVLGINSDASDTEIREAYLNSLKL